MAGAQLVDGQLVYTNPLQAQLDAAKAANASYADQLAAQQRSISGANVYHPSYTQNVQAPVSYVPQQSVVQQWLPSRIGLPQMQQDITQQWSPKTLNISSPQIGGADSLSRIANTHFAEGGIADLLGR